MLLLSLDRLAELVERVVALVDEVSLAPAPASASGAAPASGATPAPEPPVSEPTSVALPVQSAHVVFVSAPDGYRLLQRAGPAPDRGMALELDDGTFLVLRLGPSPLPGDRRRCAFVERQEPDVAKRTSDR